MLLTFYLPYLISISMATEEKLGKTVGLRSKQGDSGENYHFRTQSERRYRSGLGNRSELSVGMCTCVVGELDNVGSSVPRLHHIYLW